MKSEASGSSGLLSTERLTALEEALKEAFAKKDMDSVLALDVSVQEEMKVLQKQDGKLSSEQVARLKKLYESMRDYCQEQRDKLSDQMHGLRAKRNALNAYQQCLVAGNQ